MFQLGFEDEINTILVLLHSYCHIILFSATLNDKVEAIKEQLKVAFETVEIEKEEDNIDAIEQSAYHVKPEVKGPFLRYLIKSQDMKQVLVFVSSTRTADNLFEKLRKN